MMNRRSVLRMGLGLGSLSLSSLALTGCQATGAKVPRVIGLKKSVPPQLVNQFRKQVNDAEASQLDYSQSSQLAEIFQQLQTWQQAAQDKLPPDNSWLPKFKLPWNPPANTIDNVADLVTQGDYWLAIAIKQGLIEPLDATAWSHWENVDPIWQRLAQRNSQGQIRPDGKIWAAPYRWGATVIAYRKDLLAEQNIPPPTDWGDLFDARLQGRLSLPDSPQAVIGLALKYLGQSYRDAKTNQPTDLDQIKTLEPTLQQLQQQAKFYSSDTYLQPLILGHTWMAVGASSELLEQLRTRSDLAVVVPQSGTTLWADMWVRPKRGKIRSDRQYNDWINAFWEPEFAAKLALLSRGGTPVKGLEIAASATAKQQNPLLNLPADVWAKCEPLAQLDPASAAQYGNLWQKIRQSVPA
ncbi:extracellular solute-binding protein [filamentous cyanobacterium LEGE 11480]|uniref:Extracellular solute-binding protein n=1 Tax=Romeriopsis navalis LEGE 11480 TaxID=2777977 RepID=A0A928Z1Y5_9CYAN|nr:extracellular solute-binding protein [Romeriopsis navalis]MBE9028487.1 extracellular solute-binding protein [Romeriopsis navalis LEGE 11480]